MNWQGIVIGAAAFLIIGIFHPIVVKGEYYFSKKIWPVFLIVGVISVIATLFIGNILLAALVGIFGFSCLLLQRKVRQLFIANNDQRIESGHLHRTQVRCKLIGRPPSAYPLKIRWSSFWPSRRQPCAVMLWSIHEIIEQEECVRKGWFPANPKHPVEQKKYE